MQDVTGDLMAGVVLGLSQMTCTPVLEVIDGLGVGETDEQCRIGNRAWTRLIVGALLWRRVLEDGVMDLAARKELIDE